jgi:hypothetical protein
MHLVLRQENVSVGVYLSILFRLYLDSNPERVSLAKDRLFEICSKVLNDYLNVDNSSSDACPPAYASSKVQIILQTLKGLHELNQDQVFIFRRKRKF